MGLTSVNYCVNIRWGIIEPPRYANMPTGQMLSPIPSAGEPCPHPSLGHPLPRGIIKSLQGKDIQDKGGVQTLMRDHSDRYRVAANAQLALSRHSTLATRHCISNRYPPRLELPVTPFLFITISNSNRRITRFLRPPWGTKAGHSLRPDEGRIPERSRRGHYFTPADASSAILAFLSNAFLRVSVAKPCSPVLQADLYFNQVLRFRGRVSGFHD
jgi:hypothetical protein